MRILEVAPRKVLIYAVVLFIVRKGSFVGSLRLVEVTLLLEKHSDFNQRVNFALHCEVASENAVLEVTNSLVDLVCLCKDYS